MSSEPAVIAQGISKRYRLGEREQYGALRDVLASALRLGRSPGARAGAGAGAGRAGRRETIWAVEDVSFTVDEGEVVGIIGRNGAGKSTLLKILSRITTPTAGEIRMRGRIGSLLEVGSGFHPELTGTENVYLNGAILGMSRTEIGSKLDEIVEFAEMGDFMTTPVKHYSVGMFMRLAFAVAAHLDAEILVVDEVLAVGDARFQQKCLAKMGQVARSGRSVLFVSHNLDATLALCDRGLVLDGGRLVHEGDTRGAVDAYRRLGGVSTRIGDRIDLGSLPREGTGEARLAELTISAGDSMDGSDSVDDSDGPEDNDRGLGSVCSGGRLVIDLAVEAERAIEVPSLGLTLGTESGLLLLNLDTGDATAQGRQPQSIQLRAGSNRIRLEVPALHLAPGRYRLGLRLANPVTTRIGSGAIDLLDPACVIEIGDASGSHPVGHDDDVARRTVTQGAGSVVPGALHLRIED